MEYSTDILTWKENKQCAKACTEDYNTTTGKSRVNY